MAKHTAQLEHSPQLNINVSFDSLDLYPGHCLTLWAGPKNSRTQIEIRVLSDGFVQIFTPEGAGGQVETKFFTDWVPAVEADCARGIAPPKEGRA